MNRRKIREMNVEATRAECEVQCSAVQYSEIKCSAVQ